ncbi:oxidoreductase, aldo/keto reductase family protein [Ancylostoma caninum]|uniref:Oxidoreductase, aldo/keto reductase family protein n=1 Tax=Ancylostoma caninum TaxID=29170 RepID=A0A368F3R1_ANCCA|nr:oxidoreductase, aldo/keto reductase family protein [Ancylostoma caninum]
MKSSYSRISRAHAVQVGKAVEAALKAGYTHIDCAWIYRNQVEIGEVLKRLFSSTHKREDIFVTSKVWNTFHSAAGCKKNVEEILAQLQLKYIDLMLIHWPGGYEEGSDPFPKVRPSLAASLIVLQSHHHDDIDLSAISIFIVRPS